MAIKRVSHFIDDIDGKILEDGNGKQLNFSVDGRVYEIDLSRENADKFFAALAPFVDAARSVGAGGAGRNRRAAQRGSDVDLRAVREWARKNGHTVSDRGRVPANIVDAYKSANA